VIDPTTVSTSRNVKLLPLLACMLTVTLASACGNACLDLASRVCNCLPDDGTRATCNRRASDSEAVFPVSEQDSNFCQQQLDSNACDCKQLATPEGKAACGIAFSLFSPGQLAAP
jgi:hypothetical protein